MLSVISTFVVISFTFSFSFPTLFSFYSPPFFLAFFHFTFVCRYSFISTSACTTDFQNITLGERDLGMEGGVELEAKIFIWNYKFFLNLERRKVFNPWMVVKNSSLPNRPVLLTFFWKLSSMYFIMIFFSFSPCEVGGFYLKKLEVLIFDYIV